ncbi:DJ-1/PfpI family protein [Advenella incenata]|jgi:putative intracellular protease/amidase|uniref:DJ-1/PfpI family protein n=1 Tax=Advenella incenata TaxID=267800 RepID=A0A4Q7VPH9_9BURK|nr:DJ-1/PfpI family protein [Advenella incenata]RZT98336.1 DJ-1/PfpI family protein [Advenella incenata]
MINHTRRSILLSTLLSPVAVSAANIDISPEEIERNLDKTPWYGDERIAMLVYPGMTIMDLAGPHCMFGSLMGAKIHIVAKSLSPVTSDAGMVVVPDTTFDSCPKDLTVLFTPGGTDGTLAAASDSETLEFMTDRGARAKYVTSVCSGSLILGAAGLLTGYKATSHWSCRQALAGFGAIPTDARVVRDRNRITGAGVTAGLDFGLTMVAEMRDQIYAECTQLVGEYDPDPPFNAGSLKSAPSDVKRAMIKLLADFSKKAEVLAFPDKTIS